MAATMDKCATSESDHEEIIRKKSCPSGFEQMQMELPLVAVKMSGDLTATFRMDDATAAKAEALDLL